MRTTCSAQIIRSPGATDEAPLRSQHHRCRPGRRDPPRDGRGRRGGVEMTGTVHIRLELRPDGDCLAGRAISDEGSREFHGWLGLMGALEALYPMPAVPTTTTTKEQPAA